MRTPLVHREASAIVGTTAVVVASGHAGPLARDVIAVDVDAGDGKCFRLLTDVRAFFGSHSRELKRGFRWNGADIPRLWQWLLGIDGHDPRVALASAFHDDACNEANAGKAMRVIGDAVFVSLLMPITYNNRDLDGVGIVRALLLYAGVRTYSAWLFLKRLILNSRQPR